MDCSCQFQILHQGGETEARVTVSHVLPRSQFVPVKPLGQIHR